MSDQQPKFQWSGVFTTVINGVSINENFTFRFDTEKEMLDARSNVLSLHVPSTVSFPNDEGNIAHQKTQEQSPVCEYHNTPKTWRPPGVSKTTGKPYPGFWACSQKNTDGTYCKG